MDLTKSGGENDSIYGDDDDSDDCEKTFGAATTPLGANTTGSIYISALNYALCYVQLAPFNSAPEHV